ncbi:collagen alpha-1(IX) chain-like [Nasonia vitripennis]|uniref:Laminin G domain-containing protein n=1 Tax=Nasonia vitripennis TaxID=7425 RepID=A0A7M7QWB5_NASVI|nr:collagen alpha-1(IX) chain-like [Nasonia vitripennis]
MKDDPQFMVTLDPINQRLEVSLQNEKGSLNALSFPATQIFDKNWHKLQFGVLKHQIILYIDCNRINILDTQPRGRIDIDGRICISKYAESDLTVPIDLQWMVLYCDPSRPERESCEEIQVSHTFNFMYNKDILLRSRSREVYFSPGFQNTFGILLARGVN